MSPSLILWIIGALLACTSLVRMMRRRQAELDDLLRAFVQDRLKWARKRAKAASLADAVARDIPADQPAPPPAAVIPPNPNSNPTATGQPNAATSPASTLSSTTSP